MNISRRSLLTTGATLAGVGSAHLAGCTQGVGPEGYEQAQSRTWRAAAARPSDPLAVMRELVRCATLAPSSHNTQCWKFQIGERGIAVLPDLARRCPAVDPDDHHLFVSLGCATENLVQAAHAYALSGETRYDAAEQGSVQVSLAPASAAPSALFDAIAQRQSTRAEFDGKPVPNAELRLLEQAGTGEGVRVTLLTAHSEMENVLAYVVRGNTAQMDDAAFVEELKSWIRFGDDEAVATGDGLFSRTTGSPSVPRWLGSPMFRLFYRKDSENDKYAKQIRSAAGIAVFSSDTDDKAHWVQAGRCYQRFALQATVLGIRTAHINQPVEVSALRPEFAALLGLGRRRPDLVVRFGRGPLMPRSLRRAVQDVIA